MPPPGRDHGERVDRKPQSEAENFIQCPLCGGFVDIRYLAQVLEHEGSLPRPAQEDAVGFSLRDGAALVVSTRAWMASF